MVSKLWYTKISCVRGLLIAFLLIVEGVVCPQITWFDYDSGQANKAFDEMTTLSAEFILFINSPETKTMWSDEMIIIARIWPLKQDHFLYPHI